MSNRNGLNVSIRLATASDALILASFRYALRSGNRPVQDSEREFVERCSVWMQERLREASPWRCWIAEKNLAPVGHIWVQLVEKIPNPSSEPEYHAYITNFYVLERARNLGIGSALLSAALDWCKSCKVHAVILWPSVRSRALYLRHGFDVRSDLLELLLV